MLKSHFATRDANISFRIHVGDEDNLSLWLYELVLGQDSFGRPVIRKERLVNNPNGTLFERPDDKDRSDPHRLSETGLNWTAMEPVQEPAAWKAVREFAMFLKSVTYFHLVPQVVRGLLHTWRSENICGQGLVSEMLKVAEDTLNHRLRQIREALCAVVPQLKEFEMRFDQAGKEPHLGLHFEHMPGTWVLEDQFSDGTLRLIGLLWAVLDARGPLLIEEPELSLHPGAVRLLPQMLARLQRSTDQQIIISTQSSDLLCDEAIGLNELFLLQPGAGGTTVRPAAEFKEITALLEGGVSLAEAVMPHTSPQNAQGLAIIGD